MTLQANGFDWDRSNQAKCEKHGLSIGAIESLFTHPLAILPGRGPLAAGGAVSRDRTNG
jgi:hypothetical protein